MTVHDETPLRRVIGDTIRAALDDEGVKLPALAERRVIDRACELLELAGYDLVGPLDDDRADEPTTRTGEPA